ncbi:MAG: diguanylate cyclase [Cyanobacteria bacterium J06554_3]
MTYPSIQSSQNLFSQSRIIVWQKTSETPEASTDDFANVRHFLAGSDCELTVLDTQRKVAMAIQASVPELLIIHLKTANIGAQVLCSYLRQQAATQYLPIIFVGARAAKHERIKALRCGANSYFQIPTEPEEFGLHLAQYLRVSWHMKQLRHEQASLIQKVGEFNQTLRQLEALKASLAKENQSLQRLAFIDGLTQIANRRSFNQKVVHLWRQAWAQQQPLSLLLCDIDHFKRYNDIYGHLAGDECLKSVAAALVRGAHRYEDYVARYGGEEFAILLPETDLLGSQQVARAIHQEVAKAQIPHQGSFVKPFVSMSVGICTLVPDAADQPYETLIQQADEALYSAKLQGRDRTNISTNISTKTAKTKRLAEHSAPRQTRRQLSKTVSVESKFNASTQLNNAATTFTRDHYVKAASGHTNTINRHTHTMQAAERSAQPIIHPMAESSAVEPWPL